MMDMPGARGTTDQRLLKGARARAEIARRAAEVASIEGLTGLSLGRLAADLGISKSGVATLFGSKEKLQLAAVSSAREVFLERVVRPALREPAGIPRLRALVDRWFGYIAESPFPGGCFRCAVLTEFDSRPGPVRDALSKDRADLLDLLCTVIRRAQERDGALPGRDPYAVAFELDAVVGAANTGLRLGDDRALPAARELVDSLLTEQF
ncbi:TetR/AcrR family transcriptional regulator [Hoyosella sp. YIM 151337]|nr:TetR/AcrR family transcriptional regulator [Hoyosella sp. YIM 151337]MCW4353981.1 TetR/AcrR family transcriptional regulator [Hoyosella sp. YIM 151337]